MMYKIKIGDQTFDVSIEDINKRPIVTHVNGKEIIVTPAGEIIPPVPVVQKTTELFTASSVHNPTGDGSLTAPLPGTVIEVFVKPGDEIEAGTVILIIEAMKMKNSIRSTKDGIVETVFVSAGQTVSHKQILMEFKK